MADLIITTLQDKTPPPPPIPQDKLHLQPSFLWHLSHLCHNNIKPSKTRCKHYSSHHTLVLTLSQQQPTVESQSRPPAHHLYPILDGLEHPRQHGNLRHLPHPHDPPAVRVLQLPVQAALLLLPPRFRAPQHSHRKTHRRLFLALLSIVLHPLHSHHCRHHLLSPTVLVQARKASPPLQYHHHIHQLTACRPDCA